MFENSQNEHEIRDSVMVNVTKLMTLVREACPYGITQKSLR